MIEVWMITVPLLFLVLGALLYGIYLTFIDGG
jgi:hypothetical protein